MASSNLAEVTVVVPNNEVVKENEGFIDGIVEGLEDFAEGRYKHFKDDDELVAYMMSL